ncbi:complement decay-accelerating factor-like isoform X1 [Cebidichthys violaceus]|uniref:complement decay-accelerating factor-like isoform X1 n=2 Tax=Cebidichthys violaceus TaxID=271503 RepID=UPI0035CB7458
MRSHLVNMDCMVVKLRMCRASLIQSPSLFLTKSHRQPSGRNPNSPLWIRSDFPDPVMSVAYFLLLSSLGLAMNTQAQDCSVPVGGDNMGLKGRLQTFPNGAQVSFACNVGYRSTGGSPSITCTDGSWSPVKLKCEISNCGRAGKVVNGNIDYSEGTEFGTKLVVTCNTGYRLVGRSQIFCGVQGWMSRLPECEVQDCSVPVLGDNMGLKGADILSQTFPNGLQVSFACNSGYRSAGGSPSITCTDGRWSSVRLKCEKRNCGSAGEVVNGDIDYSEGTEFGAKLVVTCNPGYRLVGRSQIICGAKGWLDRLPECEVVQCDDPVVENATRDDGSLPPYNYTSMVTYKCISGYAMEGEHTQTCGIDGQWLPGLPTCELVTCKPPYPVVAVTFSPIKESYNFLQVVQFYCQNDYTLNGSKSLSCSEDGTFKPAFPTCIIKCFYFFSFSTSSPV